ncbi:putative quinol monooxygenase [Weeksellaceae bacterium A-14]
MNIYITAIIKAKEEFRAEVQNMLQLMVERTKQEEACIQYDLHQGIEDKNCFIFYEIWKDEAGLNKHNMQPYIQEFNILAKEKLAEKPFIYLTHKI